MEEPEFILYAELSDWPSKAALEALLRAEGFEMDVGPHSIRLRTDHPFVFRELDLPEPCITAESESLTEIDDAAARVSWALAKAGVRHRFVIESSICAIGYYHHDWPQVLRDYS